MAFQPKSFQSIVADMAAKIAAETPINDFTPGSNILTIMEAAAQEDFQQYVQMIEVVKNYSLDNTEGEELEKRAFEWGLTRKEARSHSGFITVTDSRFTKTFSKLYSGLPGPSSGSSTLIVDNASTFPATGSVYIGRGTDNSEGPISYTAAPVNNSSYWTITLDTTLVNDHGTDETVILSQFGNRTITAGTEVRIPESDTSEEVLFELNQIVHLLDGETNVENVLVTALVPGGGRIPKNSIREFVNTPFTGAIVSNSKPFVNGRDEETDQQLRDRIRETAQSLSRGTAVSIKSGILGIIDTENNSSITSANIVTPVILADGPTKVYIDNGRGLEPQISPLGLETLINSASGGETFFQLEQFPMVKASILSQGAAPFNLVGSETLILKVGNTEETLTFASIDFTNPGSASAIEVAQAINDRANTFEARTITNETGARVLLTPKATLNENIQLNVASTANSALNFSTEESATLKLYKNDKLLTKDGLTASVVSGSQPFDMSSSEVITSDDAVVSSSSNIVTISTSVNDLRELVKVGDYVKSSLDTDLFYTKVKTVVSPSKLILENKYPIGSLLSGTPKLTIWSSPQLEVAANGDQTETEIISFSKNDFSSPSTASASEVLARLQKDLNLSKSELAVNGTKIRLSSYLQNSASSKMRVIGGHAAKSLGFTTASNITGTASISSSSNIVNGGGTFFTQELVEGQWIRIASHSNGAWSKIDAIENNTTLYLTQPYSGPSVSFQVVSAMSIGNEDVGSNRDYILNRSNGQIELLSPLVAGDTLSAGSINTRGFADTSVDPFNLDSVGSSSNLLVRVDNGVQLTADSGDSSAPYNTFSDYTLQAFPGNTFVGNHIECISGANAGQTAIVTSFGNGNFTLSTGLVSPIAIGDKFVLSQILEFNHALDFADPTAVTGEELAIAINRQLIGATAGVRENGTVRIRSNSLEEGSIQILGGSSNSVLNISTNTSNNQSSNISSAVTGNDEINFKSPPIGYSLSPAQTLVVVLDEDASNKTYSIPMKIEALTTSIVSPTQFRASSLISKYPVDNSFKDFWLYWKSGAANEGTLSIVSNYVASTGTITVALKFPSSGSLLSPTTSDTFQLVPRTAKNLAFLLNDQNTTTLSSSASIEIVGPDGIKVQISNKRPGSNGKIRVAGGTANNFGIPVLGPVPGSPTNDIYVNSVAGLVKGQPVEILENGPLHTICVISDIQGTSAPYILSVNNLDGTPTFVGTWGPSVNSILQHYNGLNFPTSTLEGSDAYKNYTGLIQLAQWTIDGLDRVLETYPGTGAAGTQFEVIAPVLVKLSMIINITPIDGVTLSSLIDEVSSRILEYVNSRDVGEDVILSEIITAAQQVVGVFDAVITSHTSNIIISDGELVRLEDADLSIG